MSGSAAWLRPLERYGFEVFPGPGRWVTPGGIEGSFPPCVHAPRQPSAVPAVMKQQSALIAIPEEWILLLSGVQRRVARLSIDLHVARRLALRRITRIRAGRWCGRDGACVGKCGEAQSGTAEDAGGSDGAAMKRMRLQYGCVHFEFSFASWVLGFVCRCVRRTMTIPRRSLGVSPPNGRKDDECVSAD